MTILDFIAFVIIFAALSYFSYRSGFEEGQAAANRRHTQQLCRLRNENRILDERTNELYGRLDKLLTRLCTAEFKLKHILNMLHGRVVVKGTTPDGAADCELKYNHDSSEDTEDGVKAKIITSDMLDNAVKNQWETAKELAEED